MTHVESLAVTSTSTPARASLLTDADRVDDSQLSMRFDTNERSLVLSGTADDLTSIESADRVTLAPVSFAPPRADAGIGESYTALRLGGFDPAGDLSGLDTGFWGEVAFGRRLLKLVSVEIATGYYNVQGSGGAEVYGMPLLLQGRVGVPIAIVEPYAGVGVGGVWAHASAGSLPNKDSFAAIWDAFLGVEVGLAGVAVGLEYKYIQSADLDSPGGVSDFNLEGHVLFLTGRLPF